MNKKFKAIIAVLCVVCLLLSACQIRLVENAEGANSQTAATGKKTENTDPENTADTTKATDAPDPDDGSKTRRDEEGLVTVTIKDGVAEIEFDLDRWDELYGLAGYIDYYGYYFDDEDIELKKGPFPVMSYYDEKGVVDACLGKLPSPYGYEEEYPVPTVVFLLEDGSLEHSKADLAAANAWENFYTNQLYWLSDITSLAYADGEAIYATDKDGLRYNIMTSNLLQSVVLSGTWGRWSAPLLENSPDGNEYYGYLMFGEEGTAMFEIGVKERLACAGYAGNYGFVLAENDESGYPAGSFIFDLELEWTEGNRSFLGGLPDKLHSCYVPDLSNIYRLVPLRHHDGDYLFTLEGNRQDTYLFGMLYGEYELYEPDEDLSQNENYFSWKVEPTLDYKLVYYCGICDLFGTGEHKGDILDPDTGRVTRDKNITKNGWEGHGGGSTVWLYDEAKKLYGWYSEYEDGDTYDMFTRRQFLEAFPWLEDYLIPFRSIDSSKVKEKTQEWGIEYDFSSAYSNGKGKYAFAYNLDFVSDFIYDYDGRSGRSPAYLSTAQLDGKWGIVGSSGEIVQPFVFEHILFIYEDTVFAKYEGKYGILSIAFG